MHHAHFSNIIGKLWGNEQQEKHKIHEVTYTTYETHKHPQIVTELVQTQQVHSTGTLYYVLTQDGQTENYLGQLI